jgi:hypothetical protein
LLPIATSEDHLTIIINCHGRVVAGNSRRIQKHPFFAFYSSRANLHKQIVSKRPLPFWQPKNAREERAKTVRARSLHGVNRARSPFQRSFAQRVLKNDSLRNVFRRTLRATSPVVIEERVFSSEARVGFRGTLPRKPGDPVAGSDGQSPPIFREAYDPIHCQESLVKSYCR